MKNLECITDKINNGTGTLGAMINDPGLYDNAKSLMGEANRNRIVRNLVRQTLKEADDKANAPAPGSK
jgi:phospholipid/cholesterol/gamma-HCH transport system substrate-binding protein